MGLESQKTNLNNYQHFAKMRSSHEVRFLGLGCVPNEPGAKIGAGPDQYTACKVLNSHPDMLANLQNL